MVSGWIFVLSDRIGSMRLEGDVLKSLILSGASKQLLEAAFTVPTYIDTASESAVVVPW